MKATGIYLTGLIGLGALVFFAIVYERDPMPGMAVVGSGADGVTVPDESSTELARQEAAHAHHTTFEREAEEQSEAPRQINPAEANSVTQDPRIPAHIQALVEGRQRRPRPELLESLVPEDEPQLIELYRGEDFWRLNRSWKADNDAQEAYSDERFAKLALASLGASGTSEFEEMLLSFRKMEGPAVDDIASTVLTAAFHYDVARREGPETLLKYQLTKPGPRWCI